MLPIKIVDTNQSVTVDTIKRSLLDRYQTTTIYGKTYWYINSGSMHGMLALERQTPGGSRPVIIEFRPDSLVIWATDKVTAGDSGHEYDTTRVGAFAYADPTFFEALAILDTLADRLPNEPELTRF